MGTDRENATLFSHTIVIKTVVLN